VRMFEALACMIYRCNPQKKFAGRDRLYHSSLSTPFFPTFFNLMGYFK